MFDTIDAAINYLQGILDDYMRKGSELEGLYQGARQNLYAAYNIGDANLILEAQTNLSDTIQLMSDYQSNVETLKPIAAAMGFNTTGLGFAPAIVAAVYAVGGAAVVITAAYAVYVFYQNYSLNRDKFNSISQMVQRGQITPSQALASGAYNQSPGFLEGISSTLGNAGMLIMGGALLYFAVNK
jgi:hypothetical protein